MNAADSGTYLCSRFAPRPPSMASLLDRTNNPRSPLDYGAAVGERASRILDRTWPLGKAPHGFYDPVGFTMACIEQDKRNDRFRELIVRLRQSDLLRARGM